MYHIIYLTTNLINQKIYVGVHSTYNLEDGYIGSGVGLKRAIKKYGKHNFNRQILYYCLDASHAYEFESQIVNIEFINSPSTYNQVIGGEYNKLYRNHSELTKSKVSSTRINLGVAKGQSNPASKTNMTDEQRKLKNDKTTNTRKLNGSYIVSDLTKQKQSINRKGKSKPPFTEEHRKNLGLSFSKTFKLISPEGIEYIVNSGLRNFCKGHLLSPVIFYKFMNNGKIDIFKNSKTSKPKPQTTLNCNGWEITSI
jgi:hypothetical protein